MGRKQKQQRQRTVTPAQKQFFPASYNGLQQSGVTYENRDISQSKVGYALAFGSIMAVYRAVQLRAQAIQRLDYRLMRLNSLNNEPMIIAESKRGGSQHFAMKCIKAHQSYYGIALNTALAFCHDLYGEMYTYIKRTPQGYPSGLRWLNSVGTYPIVTMGDILSFNYSMPNQEPRIYHPDEVAYAHSFNPLDDFRGMSSVAVILDSANIDRNLRRFLSDFFRNNARPSVIISPQQPPNDGLSFQGYTPEQANNIREQLNNFLKGAGNQYSTLVMPTPTETTALEQPDLKGFYEMHEPLIKDIFAAFGVPLSMAGYTSDVATYKDGDEVLRAFYLNTIFPLANTIAEYYTDCILPVFAPGEDLWFEFDTSGFDRITQNDLDLVNIVSTKYEKGIIQLNEARQELGYEPFPDGDRLINEGVAPEDIQPTAPTEAMPVASVQYDAKAVPDKYAHINFKPTEAMAAEAERGLEWRREFGRGGTEIGIARGRDIANRRELSPDTVRRMKAYFDRHEVDKQGEGFSPSEDGYPSNGRIAWALWGGDAGQSWASARVRQLNSADETKSMHLDGLLSDDIVIDGHLLAAEEWDYTPDAAIAELTAWKKFHDNGTHLKRAFEFRYLRGAWAAEIETLKTSGAKPVDIYYTLKLWIEGNLPAIERDSLATFKAWFEGDAIKAIADVEAQYKTRFNTIVPDAVAGFRPRNQTETILRSLNQLFIRAAYVEGLAAGGVLDDPDTDDLESIADLTRKANGYLVSLMDEIYKVGITPAQAAGKAQMWYNKSISPAYYEGVGSARKNMMMEFTGDDGEESCDTCIRLKGQIHRYRDWKRRQLVPQVDTSSFACGGWRCLHVLKPTTGKAQGKF